MTNKVPLFGCKFLVLLTGSWCFLWVCACQCAATMWGESWSVAVQKRRRLRLPPALRWTLNLLFVVLALSPIPLLIWTFEMANRDYAGLKQVQHTVVRALNQAAPGYDPVAYSPMKVLTMLIPAKKMVQYKNDMAYRVRFGIWVGLVDLCLLSTLYIPILIISLREIRKRTREVEFTLTAATGEQCTRLLNIQSRLAQERRTLLQHALAIYFTTNMFIPALAWQIWIARGDFLKNQRWHTGTQLGMHLPFIVSGNIIVVILNLQARRFFKACHSMETQSNISASKARSNETGNMKKDSREGSDEEFKDI
ncbi:hypothetical protein CROQUDRAFT_109980 [Cronartium quercuum f. sp. fusiforme G11]|uniref:Uncharacterized protein n=1 Tax=Cronartium quercuum f. sp. fusiforme G11 TaxID=708437 RepID=A0A9P6T853_9BASI|nr:hypothetical protein CROQUDRAFT_109980 [Cronartium quercuum f. sp. fusiforme G11]